MANEELAKISADSWVAGQAADGYSILTAFHGRRDMTYQQLLDIATIAEIPREWLPAVKDPGVQLGRAVQEVAGNAYLAKPVRKSSVRNPDTNEVEPVRWSSRWVLVTCPVGNSVQAGKEYGRVALTVTLWENEDSMQCTYDLDMDNIDRSLNLRRMVQEAFDKRIAAQRYVAADITKWIGDVITRRLEGLRYGPGYWIPFSGRQLAETLLETVRATGWGTNWMWPPLPIANSKQLGVGLGISLQESIADVMAQLEAQRQQARDNGRQDIGPRAHKSFVAKLEYVNDIISKRALDLGEGPLDAVRQVLADAMILLDSIAESFPVDEMAA